MLICAWSSFHKDLSVAAVFKFYNNSERLFAFLGQNLWPFDSGVTIGKVLAPMVLK